MPWPRRERRADTWTEYVPDRVTWPRPAPGGDPDRQLYFLHIPKTAGTAMSGFLRSMFSPEEVCNYYTPEELVAQDPRSLAYYRFFTGHYSQTPLTLLAERPAVITVVREPHAQHRSTYEHLRREPDHEWHDLGRSNTYVEWLRDPEAAHLRANTQSRHLGGPFAPGSGISDDELFDRCVAMLEECIWYSTTDRLGATMGALGDALRWPVPTELMRMRAAPAPHAEPTDEELELVAERSPVDLRLYEYVSATVGRHEAPLTRARFDAELARAAFPLDRPLAIELREPCWGEGWWAPQLTDEKRWARWTAFDKPATVDVPVTLRAGDRIELCFVETSDPGYVTGLTVEVNGRPTRLLGVVPRAPHFVGTVEVTSDVDAWSRISILPPPSSESTAYEPVHTEGRVFAIEKLVLLPGARR